MNNYIRVLIYSKFSPSCKIILDILDQNISLKKSIVFVCIDNAEIRQQIKTDPNLKISIVPCFLHIYDENGYVEMFEGEEAFKMLESSSVELTQILPSSLGSTQILPSSLGSTQILPSSLGSTQILPSSLSTQILPSSLGLTQIQSPYVGSTQILPSSLGSTQILPSSLGLTQILPSSIGLTQILPSSLGSTQIQPPSIQPLLENRDVTFLSSVIDKPEERPRGPLNLTQMASKMQKERESSDIQPQFGPRKN